MRALAQNKGEQAIKDALAKLIDLSVGRQNENLIATRTPCRNPIFNADEFMVSVIFAD